MNLIGHLACAEPLTAAGQAGALLPDLLSLFSRRVKTRPLLAPWNAAEAGRSRQGQELVQGIAMHEQVDRDFHRAALFNECSQALRDALREASSRPGLKRMLPAHVLTELYFDHRLVALAPERAGRFYGLLAQHGAELLAPFAALDARVERRRFEAFLERMVQGRFLDDYGSLEGIFWRMDRILTRMGQRELEPAEQQAVSAVFAGRAQALEQELLAFVHAMRACAAASSSAAAPVAAHGNAAAMDAAVVETADTTPRAGGQTRPLAQGRSLPMAP